MLLCCEMGNYVSLPAIFYSVIFSFLMLFALYTFLTINVIINFCVGCVQPSSKSWCAWFGQGFCRYEEKPFYVFSGFILLVSCNVVLLLFSQSKQTTWCWSYTCLPSFEVWLRSTTWSTTRWDFPWFMGDVWNMAKWGWFTLLVTDLIFSVSLVF